MLRFGASAVGTSTDVIYVFLARLGGWRTQHWSGPLARIRSPRPLSAALDG